MQIFRLSTHSGTRSRSRRTETARSLRRNKVVAGMPAGSGIVKETLGPLLQRFKRGENGQKGKRGKGEILKMLNKGLFKELKTERGG